VKSKTSSPRSGLFSLGNRLQNNRTEDE